MEVQPDPIEAHRVCHETLGVEPRPLGPVPFELLRRVPEKLAYRRALARH
jgi:hypothetical protein